MCFFIFKEKMDVFIGLKKFFVKNESIYINLLFHKWMLFFTVVVNGKVGQIECQYKHFFP